MDFYLKESDTQTTLMSSEYVLSLLLGKTYNESVDTNSINSAKSDARIQFNSVYPTYTVNDLFSKILNSTGKTKDYAFDDITDLSFIFAYPRPIMLAIAYCIVNGYFGQSELHKIRDGLVPNVPAYMADTIMQNGIPAAYLALKNPQFSVYPDMKFVSVNYYTTTPLFQALSSIPFMSSTDKVQNCSIFAKTYCDRRLTDLYEIQKHNNSYLATQFINSDQFDGATMQLVLSKTLDKTAIQNLFCNYDMRVQNSVLAENMILNIIPAYDLTDSESYTIAIQNLRKLCGFKRFGTADNTQDMSYVSGAVGGVQSPISLRFTITIDNYMPPLLDATTGFAIASSYYNKRTSTSSPTDCTECMKFKKCTRNDNGTLVFTYSMSLYYLDKFAQTMCPDRHGGVFFSSLCSSLFFYPDYFNVDIGVSTDGKYSISAYFTNATSSDSAQYVNSSNITKIDNPPSGEIVEFQIENMLDYQFWSYAISHLNFYVKIDAEKVKKMKQLALCLYSSVNGISQDTSNNATYPYGSYIYPYNQYSAMSNDIMPAPETDLYDKVRQSGLNYLYILNNAIASSQLKLTGNVADYIGTAAAGTLKATAITKGTFVANNKYQYVQQLADSILNNIQSCCVDLGNSMLDKTNQVVQYFQSIQKGSVEVYQSTSRSYNDVKIKKLDSTDYAAYFSDSISKVVAINEFSSLKTNIQTMSRPDLLNYLTGGESTSLYGKGVYFQMVQDKLSGSFRNKMNLFLFIFTQLRILADFYDYDKTEITKCLCSDLVFNTLRAYQMLNMSLNTENLSFYKEMIVPMATADYESYYQNTEKLTRIDSDAEIKHQMKRCLNYQFNLCSTAIPPQHKIATALFDAVRNNGEEIYKCAGIQPILDATTLSSSSPTAAVYDSDNTLAQMAANIRLVPTDVLHGLIDQIVFSVSGTSYTALAQSEYEKVQKMLQSEGQISS